MKALLIICSTVFLINGIDGCKWLDNIQEQLLDFQIQKGGFHRDYVIKTKISSMDRFMDCKLALKVMIPKGAYVDIVNLDASLINHCYNSPYVFDVEQPEFVNSTKEQPVYFYLQRSIRKLFVIEDTLEFPVHLRYHAASDSLDSRTIDFKPPEAYVSCANNDTAIFSDKNCQRFVRKIPCSCGTTKAKCTYMKLNALPSTAIKQIEVPIGNNEMKLVAVGGTLVVIFIALGFLLKALFFAPTSNSTKKKIN